MKNKTTAALLALLFGYFGIHKFYLGKGGQGILYILLLFVFGLSIILGLIDAIMLFSMTEDDFNIRYNGGKNYNSLAVNNISTADELEKLHDLMTKGILTEAEFQRRKAKLL